jgi:putative FmdB family regulatory protein
VPIYEFYCADCHTIYNFFARKIDTAARPDCPRCGCRTLERRMSRFAVSRNRRDDGDRERNSPGEDDPKMEEAMESLMREAEGLDENDPRQLARMMRKLQQTAGAPMDAKTEEAIRRLESGDSPEKIEEELGDLFEENGTESGEPEPMDAVGGIHRRVRKGPPRVEETLYDL